MSILERLSRPPFPKPTADRLVFSKAAAERTKMIIYGAELIKSFTPQDLAQLKLYFLDKNWDGIQTLLGSRDLPQLKAIATAVSYLTHADGLDTDYPNWVGAKFPPSETKS